MLILNSTQKSNNFVLTMRRNFFPYKFFFFSKQCFFNILVSTHLNKMVLWSANIDTFLKLLKPFVFNLIYPFPFWESVFSQSFIPSIAFPVHYLTRELHSKFSSISSLITLVCEFLVVLVLQPLSIHHLNLLLVPINAFLSDITWAKRPTSYTILRLRKSLPIGM